MRVGNRGAWPFREARQPLSGHRSDTEPVIWSSDFATVVAKNFRLAHGCGGEVSGGSSQRPATVCRRSRESALRSFLPGKHAKATHAQLADHLHSAHVLS